MPDFFNRVQVLCPTVGAIVAAVRDQFTTLGTYMTAAPDWTFEYSIYEEMPTFTAAFVWENGDGTTTQIWSFQLVFGQEGLRLPAYDCLQSEGWSQNFAVSFGVGAGYPPFATLISQYIALVMQVKSLILENLTPDTTYDVSSETLTVIEDRIYQANFTETITSIRGKWTRQDQIWGADNHVVPTPESQELAYFYRIPGSQVTSSSVSVDIKGVVQALNDIALKEVTFQVGDSGPIVSVLSKEILEP